MSRKVEEFCLWRLPRLIPNLGLDHNRRLWAAVRRLPHCDFRTHPQNIHILSLFVTTNQTIKSTFPTHKSTNKMPPKKRVERPANENISLGPQVREGEFAQKVFT